MALKLKRFDAAKYIETAADEVEILSEAFKSGHSGYIAAALGAVARAHGMSGLAEKTGLNRSALYEALSENGNPTLDTFLKVICALDIELEAKHTTEPCEQTPAMRIPA